MMSTQNIWHLKYELKNCDQATGECCSLTILSQLSLDDAPAYSLSGEGLTLPPKTLEEDKTLVNLFLSPQSLNSFASCTELVGYLRKKYGAYPWYRVGYNLAVLDSASLRKIA
jgi:hypothetical protein